MRIIDFHTHLDERWFHNPLMTHADFIAGMDRTGIDIACVFTMRGFYEDCTKHNDLLAERASRNADRLIPFITVDPKLGQAAVEELNRCVAMKVFRGIKFHTWLQAVAPSMVKSTFVELLKVAAKHDLPVIFHDGTPPYSTTFQIAKMARWVPDAKIVLGHAGLADYTIPAAQLVRDIPNLYACVCGPRTAGVKYLVNTAGSEKLLFGSDYGLSNSLIIDDLLDSVRHAGLSEPDLQLILRDNAAKLLHLPQK